MYLLYFNLTKFAHGLSLMMLWTMLLIGCTQSHQLGAASDPQALLDAKLANPKEELSAADSVTLVNYCASLGAQSAAQVAGKEVVAVVGNTGSGKSTFLNYLLGCKMQLKNPRELGLPGMYNVAIVDESGPRREIMKIGHGGNSKTFMPQLATDLSDEGIIYCDCPNFSDNRGAEINIANALNMKRFLQEAGSVKVIFLAEFGEFLTNHGQTLNAMEGMVKQVFGGETHLRRHKNAVLLGITKAPLDADDEPVKLSSVRTLLDGSPLMQILSERLFMYDPLDRGSAASGFWLQADCLAAIGNMDNVPGLTSAAMFQTELTSDDEEALTNIVRVQAIDLQNSLDHDDYATAAHHWHHIRRLSVIEHEEMDQIQQELILSPLASFTVRRVTSYEENAAAYHFDEAERQLALLHKFCQYFPARSLQAGLAGLDAYLAECKEHKREQEEVKNEEARADAALEVASQQSVVFHHLSLLQDNPDLLNTYSPSDIAPYIPLLERLLAEHTAQLAEVVAEERYGAEAGRFREIIELLELLIIKGRFER
jgi:energy-coupling factor transporter ATP-binding protein EcfA2